MREGVAVRSGGASPVRCLAPLRRIRLEGAGGSGAAGRNLHDGAARHRLLRHDAAGRLGFTLIEVLIVISLIALLLGIGLGAFTRLDFGERVSVSLVQNVLRAAHNGAIARGAPARVRIDAVEGSLHAEGQTVIGTWHFEALPIEGAFDLDGVHAGGELVDGFVGSALSFAGEPSRSHATIPVETDPAWDLRLGFAIQCALSTAGGGGSLLDLGAGVVGLTTTENGSIQGWLTSEIVDPQGAVVRGPRAVVTSPPGVLRPDRWTQVELRYDRARLALLVDRIAVAEVAEDAPVWKLEGPLVISPGTSAWPGAIDNLVVSAVVGDEASRLPRSVAFAPGTPREIVFAAGGGLDRQFHREPVELRLELEDGRRLAIRVNLFGTVE